VPNKGDLIGGKYELIEPLGSVARATVWKAVHKTLESTVVVKFVPDAATDDAIERFIRESKAAAAVRHHNVVGIIDFGKADGEPYMVLEHLTGETLDERLAHGPPMSAREAVSVATLALTGLAAVHEAGFVHRDLNPRNVFLVREAEGSYPKLLDFGVSKAIDRDSGQLTLDGMVLGVPEYVSPEQASGQRDIDVRADLYSLGAITFEMLVGHRPFDPIGRPKVLVHKVAHDPPPLASFRPDLAPLSAVIARALSRDRDERFPDARSMRQALLDAETAIDPAVLRAPGPERGSLLAKPEPPQHDEKRAPSPPRIVTPPNKSGSIVRTIVLLVILAAAGAYAVELWRPGTILPEPPLPPGAAGEIALLSDAGVVPIADAGIETIALTIQNVPIGSTISIDGEPLDAAAVDAHRDRTSVVIAVPRRAGAFELTVNAPGHRPWSVRRWALRDVRVSTRLTPL
jgi:serine/threonine protein kinase